MAGLVPFNRRNNSLISGGFEDFNNMINEFFNENWPSRKNFVKDTFKIDVQENEKEYVIEAELPGANKDEVNVELSDGRLMISFEKEEKIDQEKKNYIHKERRYSSMSRCIYLEDAKQDGVEAQLEKGLLTITVPKQEMKENIKKIEVK
ncbi:MAG: Hsp20/alpha crystallin family protein [Anaerovoracaceae bacterium]